MTGNRIIAIIAVLFIFYSIAMDKFSNNKVKSSTQPVPKVEHIENKPLEESSNNIPKVNIEVSSDGSFIEKKIAKMLNNALNTEEGREAIKKVIQSSPDSNLAKVKLPQEFDELNILEDIKGNGNEVECGQKVTINYKATSLDGKEIDSSTNFSMLIGQDPKLKPLSFIILGMKKGGKRTANVSLFINKDTPFYNPKINPDGFASFNVELIDSSIIPTSKGKLQIFNNNYGIGYVAACGNKVSTNYQIYKLDGELLFDSKKFNLPMNIEIGSQNTPYGISKALLYANKGTSKTIIMPPEYALNNIFGNKVDNFYPKDINLPENEMMIFNIELN